MAIIITVPDGDPIYIRKTGDAVGHWPEGQSIFSIFPRKVFGIFSASKDGLNPSGRPILDELMKIKSQKVKGELTDQSIPIWITIEKIQPVITKSKERGYFPYLITLYVEKR